MRRWPSSGVSATSSWESWLPPSRRLLLLTPRTEGTAQVPAGASPPFPPLHPGARVAAGVRPILPWSHTIKGDDAAAPSLHRGLSDVRRHVPAAQRQQALSAGPAALSARMRAAAECWPTGAWCRKVHEGCSQKQKRPCSEAGAQGGGIAPVAAACGAAPWSLHATPSARERRGPSEAAVAGNGVPGAPGAEGHAPGAWGEKDTGTGAGERRKMRT